ncbi:PREDICTED: toll-like receptor 3 [Branchiostoma belcheri]|uniref:Toll-like receptor 3 n=1 Tax=Branchiostoma belcheri TaxID=7741 RepID=A0A6P4ZFI7_BRABE|nr:PREDICTED: toll-like receptor 3 [Branchiostoma belcheri]XP_019639991.1 PREDICTED: toll-like receptor 3 [Branchiostoma belcheri]
MAAGRLALFVATTLAVWSVSQQTPPATGQVSTGARGKSCRVYNRTVADCSSMRLRSVLDAAVSELPPTIKTLYLLSNGITTLPDCAFCHLTQLEFVDLSFCNITSVSKTAFAKLVHMKTILLIGNNLTTLENGTFEELQNITEVNLADNKLTEIPYGAFPVKNSLRILDLSGNHVNLQDKGTTNWDRFKSLRHILLRLNGISSSTGWIFAREDLNVSLRTLDLSYNKISRLDSAAFNGIRSLQRLVLSSNDILTVNTSSFSSLAQTGLETLVLFRNNLTSVTDNTFTSVPLLKRLDLAYNNISRIEDNAFEGLRHLEVLSLYLNPLWSAPMAALEKLNSSLLELDLRFCSMLNIQADQFRRFGNLLSLNISDNYIGALGSGHRLTGTEFRGLDNLTSLNIGGGPGYNRMKIIEKSFVFLPKLQKLVMSGLLGFNENFEGSFEYNPDLRLIDMDRMNIRVLNPYLFQDLRKLEELVLSNNNLYLMLNSDSASSSKKFARFFGDLTNLQTLRLQGNRLESLQKDIFQNLTKLRYLNLGPGLYGDHNNRLSNLQRELFKSLTSLETLRIDGNLLTSVEKSVFEPVSKSLKELYIYRNNFDCTCENLRWFREWVNNTRADVIGLAEGRLTCATPRKYANESILSFHPEVDCVSQVEVIASITTCSVFLVVAVATIVCRQFGLHKYVQYVWVLVTRRRKEAYERLEGEDLEVEYDAYVSHSAEDVRWIQDVLIPNLEQKSPQLKLCIPDRDTMPGPIIDNVQDYIRRSRKTLCLVTQQYLDQEASWLEMQVASYRLFDKDDRRDVVVMVFLEPIPKNKLTHFQKLRKLLRPGMFLQWPGPDDTAGHPLFWLLLRDALGTSNNPVPRDRPQVI